MHGGAWRWRCCRPGDSQPRGVQFVNSLIVTWVASPPRLDTEGSPGLGISIRACFALFSELWMWALRETQGRRMPGAGMAHEGPHKFPR
jgi:hypothetical protein